MLSDSSLKIVLRGLKAILTMPIHRVRMSAAKLLLPSRFRRGPARESVEVLLERIDALTLERQELRARAARPAALERNRIKIARAQWALSHALIKRHLPQNERTAA